MAIPVLFLRQAPAGWIGQASSGDDGEFLDVTGAWCPTPDAAYDSAVLAADHERKLARKRIERLEERIRKELHRLGELTGVVLGNCVRTEQTIAEDEARFRSDPRNR